MNIILVLIDSLNRRALSAYGPSEVATPHLTAFAQRARRFDRHFVGSLPCMPARREIYTGTAEVLWRPWGPLEPFDARLPRLLARNGYRTAIVTDHYHYWEELANGYLQSFASAELIRGHELDFWQTPLSTDEPLPAWVQQIERWRPGQGRRYYSALLFKNVDPGTAGQIASGHFLPDVALPQWRVPARSDPLSRENFLFHRQDDPDQRRNLWDEEPAQRARMLGVLRTLMDRAQAPDEQYARLGV